MKYMILTFLFIISVTAADFTKISDISYVPNASKEQQLDLYMPKNVTKPQLLIWVHGGAWMRGDKNKS
jgi:acetyl esterase/lipase